jgi:DNA-nicking Smr family endonuclease
LSNDISEKDKKDWENFISSDEQLPNKDLKLSKEKLFKVKSIDLHGYTLEEANKTIEEFIYQSFSEKINKLIVVTGKGLHSQNEKDPYVSKNLSILKYSVPEFIESNKSLMNIKG